VLGIIGDLVEDIIVWLAEDVQHGTDTDVELFHVRGGSAANVAGFASRLGPTRFIGCVGDDRLGDALVQELAAEGVDVRVQRRGDTGTIVILIDPTGERTMLPHRGAATRLERVPDEWLDGLQVLHVPAYSFDGEPVGSTAIDAIRRARRRGILVSIDASSTGMLTHYGVQRFIDLMAELKPHFIIGNNSESALLGLSVAGEPGENLVRFADTIVVTKAGAEPTVIHRPGADRIVVPVPPVDEIKDLTGAGDAFAAGFLSTFIASGDLTEACVSGHAIAAKVLASPGATAAWNSGAENSGAKS